MIKRRRFKREKDSSYGASSSGVAKIGWDIRADGAARPKPQRLRGFIICHDSKDTTGKNNIIDWATMAALGYGDEAKVQAAIAQGIKADPDFLPTTLYFVLPSDAKRVASGWRFPGTYAEQFACWDGPIKGLYCAGDGETAQRKDNSRGVTVTRTINCVPIGSTDNPDAPCCPLSAEGKCKPHARLVVCLIKPNGLGGYDALSRGGAVRHRIDTSSEYALMRIADALNDAADRLDGMIAGIPGSITVAIQNKRNPGGGVSPTPQLHFALDEGEIRRRQEAMRREVLEDKRLTVALLPGAASAPQPGVKEEATAEAEILTREEEIREAQAQYAELERAYPDGPPRDDEGEEQTPETQGGAGQSTAEPVGESERLAEDVRAFVEWESRETGRPFADLLKERSSFGGKPGLGRIEAFFQFADNPAMADRNRAAMALLRRVHAALPAQAVER
ncbi:MAG: hypothetical protein RLY93_09605 [Sumerlaeia bacterium]